MVPQRAEAQFGKQVLHDGVVPVRVDAQMAALPESPADAERAYALYGAVRGDAVDDAVGAVVQPRAVLDMAVGGLDVPAHVEEERADHAAFVDADVALAPRDVLPDERLGRPVGRPPLVGVAVRGHERARVGVDVHHAGKVGFGGAANFHGYPSHGSASTVFWLV